MNNLKYYAIILLLLTSILLASFLLYSHKKLQEEQKSFNIFQDRSKEFIYLNNKWNTNRNYRKIISRLKYISKPKIETTKGHIKIFEFINLSQRKLERIAKILFNSNLNIQQIEIQKNNNSLTLHIEVKL